MVFTGSQLASIEMQIMYCFAFLTLNILFLANRFRSMEKL